MNATDKAERERQIAQVQALFPFPREVLHTFSGRWDRWPAGVFKFMVVTPRPRRSHYRSSLMVMVRVDEGRVFVTFTDHHRDVEMDAADRATFAAEWTARMCR